MNTSTENQRQESPAPDGRGCDGLAGSAFDAEVERVSPKTFAEREAARYVREHAKLQQPRNEFWHG